MTDSSRPIWRLCEAATLLWRSWDDEFVVFNIAANQTHLLDAFSAAVLKELEVSPKTLQALTSHFAAALGTDGGQVSQRLEDAGARFAELGLIERLDT